MRQILRIYASSSATTGAYVAANPADSSSLRLGQWLALPTISPDMCRLLAAAVVFLMTGPAMAQVITLECPKEPDGRDADTVVHERYQITLNPPSVYNSWKRTGGKYAHDWTGVNLSVETVTPYKIEAYKPAQRLRGSVTIQRIDYSIDRTTLVVTTSVSGSSQCALVKNASTIKPKF